MIFNANNANLWSTIGSRASFGFAALELGQEIDDLFILTGDTSTSAGLERFKKAYPDKLLDVGIAEQNLIGIAAGLASEGIKVITTTFAPFQTMRCCEQIKVNLGYMKQDVCMVGLASGVIFGTFGYTHCCIEDIAIMRAIPGITVISPADCTETIKATLAAAKYSGPVYIRLTGGTKNPIVYTEDYDFQIGKAITLREGNDLTIIATGTMVAECIQAATILDAQGIFASVLDMHTIVPLDITAIDQACQHSKLIVTVEEHSVVGGLGSAVAEYKTTKIQAPPQILLGMPHQYGKGGEYRHLLERNGLTGIQIAATLKNSYTLLFKNASENDQVFTI